VNAVMMSSCCLIRGELRVELLGSGKCPIVFKLARIAVGRHREETRPRRDPLLANGIEPSLILNTRARKLIVRNAHCVLSTWRNRAGPSVALRRSKVNRAFL
jgi:hypothetical protein